MLELVLDTPLPAADGRDVEVVVEGVLVPVDSDDVLVVPARVLVVVEEESYCKETEISLEMLQCICKLLMWT